MTSGSKGRRLTPSMNRYRVRNLTATQKAWIRRQFIGPLAAGWSRIARLVGPVLPRALTIVDRPIFIVGCSRSGTTIVHDLFASHRHLSAWTEAPELLEPAYWRMSGSHYRSAESKNAEDYWRLRLAFGLLLRISGRPRLVNKHPENSLRIGWLHEIFPDCLVIHVIRDGRAVVRSSMAQRHRDRFRMADPLGFFPRPTGWEKLQAEPEHIRFALQWKEVIHTVRSDAGTFLNAKSYKEIRYEDFCDSPRSIIGELDRFAGLEPDPRDHVGIPLSLPSQNDKWRSDLSDEEIRGLDEAIGADLRELGCY